MKVPPAKGPVIRSIHGAPSWRIANDVVEAWLTRDGGHLGPVHFKTKRGCVQPYSVAPWLPGEVARDAPGVLRNLRGDFFCLPFGVNSVPWRGEQHVLHGATSEARWRLVGCVQSSDTMELVAQMHTRIGSGVITKRVRLLSGQTVLYCSHEIEGMSGLMCLGHHAMLRLPDHEGAGRIACSAFRFGQVRPERSENPGQRGYSSLRQGAIFHHLRRVPRQFGGYADLTRYPARQGFDDLVLLATRPSRPLAWVAVTFPKEKYLWFALKDPKLLVSTLLWQSNGGRHSPPWNGRHRPVLGIEDMTGFFDFGLAASARPNLLSRQGVPTAVCLRDSSALRIPYVMGVTPLPNGFESVRRVHFRHDHIVFVSGSGVTVHQQVDLSFFSQQTRKRKEQSDTEVRQRNPGRRARSAQRLQG